MHTQHEVARISKRKDGFLGRKGRRVAASRRNLSRRQMRVECREGVADNNACFAPALPPLRVDCAFATLGGRAGRGERVAGENGANVKRSSVRGSVRGERMRGLTLTAPLCLLSIASASRNFTRAAHLRKQFESYRLPTA